MDKSDICEVVGYTVGLFLAFFAPGYLFMVAFSF